MAVGRPPATQRWSGTVSGATRCDGERRVVLARAANSLTNTARRNRGQMQPKINRSQRVSPRCRAARPSADRAAERAPVPCTHTHSIAIPVPPAGSSSSPHNKLPTPPHRSPQPASGPSFAPTGFQSRRANGHANLLPLSTVCCRWLPPYLRSSRASRRSPPPAAPPPPSCAPCSPPPRRRARRPRHRLAPWPRRAG